MKQISTLFAALAMLFLALTSPAAPTQFIGTLTTVNNSTNYSSTGITAFTFNQTLQQFSVTHTALTNLTSLRLDIYANVRSDSTNGMVQVGTWFPSNTNAATETFSGSSFTITNFIFIGTATTNNVGVGGTYGN